MRFVIIIIFTCFSRKLKITSVACPCGFHPVSSEQSTMGDDVKKEQEIWGE